MKTLDEQIAYMKTEVDWYENKVRTGKDWCDELTHCMEILKTLENLKSEQSCKVPL